MSVCICVFARMYPCVYSCLYTHIHAWLFTSLCTHIYTHACAHVDAQVAGEIVAAVKSGQCHAVCTHARTRTHTFVVLGWMRERVGMRTADCVAYGIDNDNAVVC